MAEIQTCFVAENVRALLREGRKDEAIDACVDHLLNGSDHSAEFLKLVTEQLKPRRRKRGRPAISARPFWLELGQRFEDLKEQKINRHDAIAVLRTEFPQAGSDRSIAKSLAEYKRNLWANEKAT